MVFWKGHTFHGFKLHTCTVTAQMVFSAQGYILTSDMKLLNQKYHFITTTVVSLKSKISWGIWLA